MWVQIVCVVKPDSWWEKKIYTYRSAWNRVLQIRNVINNNMLTTRKSGNKPEIETGTSVASKQ